MNKKFISLLLGGVMCLSVGALAGCDAVTPEQLSNYLKHGVDAPNEETGEVGTYYYETDEGNMWYRYEDKGWTIISNLKGEKGDKGDPGDSAEMPDYIIEKEYSLMNMFVIADYTDVPGYYPYTSGQFVTSLTGSIDLADCKVVVEKEKASLVYTKTDGENTAVANYSFILVDAESSQPTFTYDTCVVTLNGEVVVDYTDETLNELMDVTDVITNDYIYRSGDTSVKLISQDTSFTVYFQLRNSDTKEPILITQLYGY